MSDYFYSLEMLLHWNFIGVRGGEAFLEQLANENNT